MSGATAVEDAKSERVRRAIGDARTGRRDTHCRPRPGCAARGRTYGIGSTLATAQKPADRRTLRRLFLPELRWVDSVAPKARIAALLAVNVKQDTFPPFYGLYGRHFEHRVLALPRRSRAGTVAWLSEHSIDAVYVDRPSPQDSWFRSDKRFRPLFANTRVAAYATPAAPR